MKIILTCGGTGGHIYPALTLYLALENRGHQVLIVTDDRGEKIIQQYSIYRTKQFIYQKLNSKNSSGNILQKILSIILLIKNIFDFIILFLQKKPDLVWSFGSNISLSAIFAAWILRINNGLYHADFVLTNVHSIGIHLVRYITLMDHDITCNKKNKYIVGAIIRKEYKSSDQYDTILNRILIIGGSQGASIWNIIPSVIYNLDLEIIHQTNNIAETEKYYKKYNITNVHIIRHIDNMSQHIQEANIILSRAGIMSISEILFHNKYALYLPLNNSSYDHQNKNGSWVENQNYGFIIRNFNIKTLRTRIISMTQQKNIIKSCHIKTDGDDELVNLMEKINSSSK